MDGIQILGPAGYERVPSGDEEALKRAVRQRGPVTAMFTVAPDFFSYMDGVYSAPSTGCNPGTARTVSHALLIIGYGTDNGQDYWLVQNSWGESWGMNGFAKIARGSNTCGISSCASYPINIVEPEK
jgi:C1A family cysteine protease